MTYDELKARLTKCEIKLEEFKAKNSLARNSKNYNTAVEKLTLLKESLQKQLKEAEETMFVSTKGGDTKAVKMDRKQAMDLKKDPNVTSIDTAKGQDLKEGGVEFSKEETAAIAKQVGKAVAKSLHGLGDEVAHMKAKDIEPNSFEIYVQYKKDTSDDTFSFYISDDTLHLVDFSFDKELGGVGVKPSGEAIVHVDVLANELTKHFKSMQEGMTDKEWADAEEADRLEKHPEKDTIKKIQALIASQQKSEATKEEEEEYHEKLDALTHKTFGKRKEELEEDINLHKIEVSIRDAKKAQDIMYDMYDHQFEQNGSNVYLFDDEQTAYDAMMDLTSRGIEVENIEDFDDIEEGIHDLDITSSPVGHIKNTSKQDQAYSDSNKAQRKRYTDDEWDKLTNPLRRYSRFDESEVEDQGGDLDIGHQDDEPDMLKKSVYDIAMYAAKLYKALDKYDQMDAEVDFPTWWQSKIILARDYVSSAQHYLEFEEKQPAIDALALEERVVSDNEAPSLKAKIYAEDMMRQYRKMFRIVSNNFGSEAGEEFKNIVKTKIAELQESAERTSYNKLKKEYDALVGKMKQLAQHFKTAEGEKKAKIVAALKQHTARKRELEALIDQTVSGVGQGQELDPSLSELFGSKVSYDEIIGPIEKGFAYLKKYVLKKEPDAMPDLEKAINFFDIFDEKMSYGTHMELEQVNEAKATCCGKCGRVHVKGTECKRPFLKGKDHCRYN